MSGQSPLHDPNWLARQLELLLTGYGYNLYNDKNRARADDLLVREKASGALGAAAGQLARLALDYSQTFVPPATREQPFPPADVMARLKAIEALRAGASVAAAAIRGMPVPTHDRTWARFRDEKPMLHELLQCDYQLVTTASALERMTVDARAESWNDEAAAAIRSQLDSVEEVARGRAQLLSGRL